MALLLPRAGFGKRLSPGGAEGKPLTTGELLSHLCWKQVSTMRDVCSGGMFFLSPDLMASLRGLDQVVIPVTKCRYFLLTCDEDRSV